MKKYGLKFRLAVASCVLAAGLTYAFNSGEFAQLQAPLDQARQPLSTDAELSAANTSLSYKQLEQSRRLRNADANGTTALALDVASPVAGSSSVYAVMMYSSAWNDDTGAQKGIYSIPTDGTSTTPTVVKLDEIFTECGYAVGMPDKYLFAQVMKTYGVIMSLTQYTYNTADWSPLSTLKGDITSRNFSASDAAYNPVTTEVYGSVLDIKANTWGLYRITTEDKLEFKKIASLDKPFVAMSFDNAGKLYAVTEDGKFITYDLITKSASEIASGMSLSTKYTSGTIDNTQGKFYYAVCNDNESALCSIDLATGAIAKLYDFANGEEFVGMYIPSASPSGVLPDVAQNLALSFEGGSLTGKITFDCPKNNTDGSAGEGEVTYTVYAGINKTAEGKSAYGESVSADVEVPANGEYTFTVRVSNATGEGAAAKISKWVGNDVPNKITSAPKVTYANGKATITWSAPYQSVGVNGGYVDKNKYTYTVVRNNDGKLVAENTPDRSAVDEFEAPEDLTMFTYDVTVNYEGGSSEPTTSATLALGSIRPPFAVDFTSDPMSFFTTLDANKDYKTWSYSSVYKRVHISTNKDKAMDDWLFTLPLNLKSGHAYNFSFDTFGGAANMVQTMEVFLGTAPEVDAMTTLTIMEKQDYTNVEKTPLTVVYDIEVPQDGLYYIGFHALSEANQNYICLNNIKIAAGTSLDSPAPVSDFVVTPAMNGDLKAEISLVAPTKTFRGSALESLTAIEVRCGDELVKKFENPKPGETCTYTHVLEKGGQTDYIAVAINDKGESQEAAASAFVGHTVPYAPATASMVENSPGNVTFTWSEVTTDANGKTLDPATITYAVMELDQDTYSWVARAEGISGTTHTMQIRKATEEQDFLSLAIGADNSFGRSKYRAVEQVPVGVPYELPFIESNAGNRLTHTFLTKKLAGEGYVRWNQGNNSSVQGMIPSDGDGGYLYMTGEQVGDKSALVSGKISLEGAKKPVMSVAYVHFANDRNKVGINIICDGVETPLDEWETNGTSAAWARRNMSLEKYVGKTIQFVLYGEIQTSKSVFVDCIEIIDYPQKDIAISGISAPATLQSGQSDVVKVLVENKGLDAISDYKVTFYVNGEVVSSQASAAELPFRGQVVYSCPISATPLSDSEYNVYAEVVCAGDLVADNNKSKEVTVEVLLPTLPAPENLVAKLDASGKAVNLTWSDAADLSLSATAVTEDCEALESFAVSGMGEWTSIDADKSISQQFNSLNVPHMGSEAFGFMVFDVSDSQFNSTFNARSGNKYFMAFTNEAAACDDWLISPELSGKAQTVSFYARSYNPNSPESFEILYSTTGKEIADFKVAKVYNNIDYTFQQYAVELPEGATYFAIRCVSKNGVMFIVDDITFSPKGELNVVGYNVYRDGSLVKSGVSAKEYTDAIDQLGSYVYNVTAVYNYGESKASNAAGVVLSGIEDTAVGAVKVSVVGRAIVVTGAAGDEVEIYNPAGTRLFSETSSGYSRYEATQGVYLVKAGANTYKVAVQ